MRTAFSSTEFKDQPNVLIRFVAALLVLVVMMSTMALILGYWYKSTILSLDWYRPVIKNQAFQEAMRDSIIIEISGDIDKSGIFAPILRQALEQGLTSDRIEAFLDKYLVHFVDYLNDRSASPLPTDASELFSDAFLSYARDASQKLGIPLPASVEKQIERLAARIGEIAEDNIDILTRESFKQMARLERYHRILLWISQSLVKIMLVWGTALLLLLFLFIKQISRFFSHALFGICLAGALIGLPLLAVRASDVTRLLIKTPDAIKPMMVSMITLASDSLKTMSLTVFAGAATALVILFLVRLLVRKKA